MLKKYIKSKTFLIPTLFLAIFLGIMLLLLFSGEHKYYHINRMLSQWDGQHYLSIARDGYQMYPCGHLPSGFICGNVGWFPVFPMVSNLLSWLPVNINLLMIIISWLSFWGGLLILFWLVENKFNQKTAIATLIALAFFPGSFYFLTVFPYSFYLLLLTAVFYFLEKKNYKFLFILTGLLAATYPSGILISLPILYILFKERKTENWSNKIQLFGGAFTTGLALLLFCSYFFYKFGEFFLYNRFQAQEYYAHGLTFPFTVIYKTFVTFGYTQPIWLIMVFVLIMTILFYSRKLPVTWQLFLIAILLFSPTFGSFECYYRHIVPAFPLYVMVGYAINSKYRKYLIPAYVVSGAILMWYVYLPLFKNGQLM